MPRPCMVTGGAGFSGSRLPERLLGEGWEVVGVDAFTDSYDPSEKRARAEVLAMDKRRSDYARARALLRDKIEPARLHLLRYYAAKAEAAQRHHDWSVAMDMYEQAAAFSIHPAALQRKQRQMSLRMRQVRLDALLKQRRREDEEILSWQRAYRTPLGVDVNDPAYRRQREAYADLLDERASGAYAEAKRYLRQDMPELAYVEIESYLRYEPDSEQGKKLEAEIRQAMPKGLRFRPGRPAARIEAPVLPMVRQPGPNTVDVADIRAQMQRQDWLEARRLALVYRREGGEGAAALLEHIQAQIAAEAASAVQQGNIAFRKENIDAAVGHWGGAGPRGQWERGSRGTARRGSGWRRRRRSTSTSAARSTSAPTRSCTSPGTSRTAAARRRSPRSPTSSRP